MFFWYMFVEPGFSTGDFEKWTSKKEHPTLFAPA
jgi:hypothetical protein